MNRFDHNDYEDPNGDERQRTRGFCLAPTIVVTREPGEIKTADDWCRKVRFHRFATVAASHDAAYDMVQSAIQGSIEAHDDAGGQGDDDGCCGVDPRKHGAGDNRNMLGGMVEDFRNMRATLVMFPGDAGPRGTLEGRSVFCHIGVLSRGGMKGSDGSVHDCAYRTLVAASGQEMTDWLAREAASEIWKNQPAPFEDSAVVRLFSPTEETDNDGAVIYLGPVIYDEVRANYRKLFGVIEDNCSREDREESIDKFLSEGNPGHGKSLEEIKMMSDFTVRSLLPNDSGIRDFAWSAIKQVIEDSTARFISKDPDESPLVKQIGDSLISRLCPTFFRPKNGSVLVVSAGMAPVTEAFMERARAISENPELL